jgi:hypothetical protein
MPPASQSLKTGCPILNFALFAKFRVGTLTGPHRPSRNNSVIPTGAKRSGGTLRFRSGAKTSVLSKQAQGGILHQGTVTETVLPRN